MKGYIRGGDLFNPEALLKGKTKGELREVLRTAPIMLRKNGKTGMVLRLIEEAMRKLAAMEANR